MSFKIVVPCFVLVGFAWGIYIGTAKYKSTQTKQIETQSPAKYTNPITKAYGGIAYRRYKALRSGKNALLIRVPVECGLQGVEFIKVDLYSRTQDGKYSVEDGKCEIYESSFDWITNEIEEEALDAARE